MQLPFSANDLLGLFPGKLVGNPDAVVHSFCSLEKAQQGTLSFLSRAKYAPLLKKVGAGAVIITREEWADASLNVTYFFVTDPESTFAALTTKLTPAFPWKGVSPQAQVDPSCRIATSAAIGPFCTIEKDVVIGENTHIHPNVHIGAGTVIGANTVIFPHVSLYNNTIVGNHVTIHAGTVIGSCGFGLYVSQGHSTQMPHIGKVVIEDFVRIGAKCTIDRATLQETRIGKYTNIDDQVHIGHNCQVGQNVIICSMVGVSGSCIIEDDVFIGGKVGLGPGLTVGKGAKIAAGSGSSTNFQENTSYMGSPAIPLKDYLRSFRYYQKLPEIWSRLVKLEEKTDGR